MVAAVLLPLALLEGGARIMLHGRPPAALIAAPLDDAPNLRVDDVFCFDADLFWRLRPRLDVDALPWADRTTSSGFRGVEDPAENSHVPRVVALGDSCTYGFGLPFDAAWPAQLAEQGGMQVVNAAVPGYSTYQGRLWWERIAAETAPDAVVIEFGNNDAAAWPTRRNGGVVFLTDQERARHLHALELLRTSAFLGWVLAQGVDAPQPVHDLTEFDRFRGTPRVPVAEFEERLRSLADAVPRAVLLRWPRRRELAPSWIDPSPRERDGTYAAAFRRVASEGHVLVDVGAEFRASGHSPAELFVDDVHASRLGNAVVAAAVRRALDTALAK